MRKKLKKLKDQKLRFSGTFERFGEKKNWHGYPEKTILLKDIRVDTEEIVTDHLWFNYTKGFQNLGQLSPGDTIEFNARIAPYIKGYINNREYIDLSELDYKMNRPTKIKLTKKESNPMS